MYTAKWFSDTYVCVCVYIYTYMYVCVWKWTSLSHVQLFATPWTIQSMGFSNPEYCPWDSPIQGTGVASCFLLQGIFPTQGSNPHLSHCRQILYQLSHQGSPRILEWVVYPFSSWSSWSRNRTGVSCIAGRFFASWATRKAHVYVYICTFPDSIPLQVITK